MTRKDFELIAATIARVDIGENNEDARCAMAEEFSRILGATELRFDRKRFLRACGCNPNQTLMQP